uniref:Putative monolaris n=1 Tax=Amblyomma parvum TaxID=251391 RepID=A0A023FYG3_AMBPA
MDISKALLLFALVALGYAAVKRPPKHDQRCKSDRQPIQSNCTHRSFVYVRSGHKCTWTCGKGPFVTQTECDGVCRTPAVCTLPRPFESCTHPFKVYYLQLHTGKCVLDTRGCRYTGNNFPTKAECRRTCKG